MNNGLLSSLTQYSLFWLLANRKARSVKINAMPIVVVWNTCLRTLIFVLSLPLSIPLCAGEREIGILEIPSIFPNYFIDDDSIEKITNQLSDRRFNLRESPTTESKVLSVLSDGNHIASAEFGYEQIGALVYESAYIGVGDNGQADIWYKIFRFDTKMYGWINHHPEMKMHHLTALLKDGIVSTDYAWDGILLDSLGPGSKKIDISKYRILKKLAKGYIESENLENTATYEQMAATAVQFDTWNGEEWMLVLLFEESFCSTHKRQPRIIAAGWMRMYSDIDRTNAWFSSRGC